MMLALKLCTFPVLTLCWFVILHYLRNWYDDLHSSEWLVISFLTFWFAILSVFIMCDLIVIVTFFCYVFGNVGVIIS